MLLAMHHDVDAAEELLEQAIERGPWPLLCRRVRRRLADVARAEGVPYVDATDLLFRRAVASPSKSLFVDATHPSALGHAAIADRLFEIITGRKPPDPTAMEGEDVEQRKEPSFGPQTPSGLSAPPKAK